MLSFLWYLIVGGFAGWLAGKVMKGKGFGLFGNIGIGILGGFLGGWVFRFLGVTKFENGDFLTAFIGAILLLWIVRMIKRK